MIVSILIFPEKKSEKIREIEKLQIHEIVSN